MFVRTTEEVTLPNLSPEAAARDTYRLYMPNGQVYWESIHAGMFPANYAYPKPPNWYSPQTLALGPCGNPPLGSIRANGRTVAPCDAYEILIGGHRGGTKTATGIVWIGKGNLSLPPDNPIYASYFNHPKYRALVLRENATDLKDWQDKFQEFWKPLGITAHGDPPYYRSKAGARVYTNHLEDEAAFEKYKGWEFHRILIEELTHIRMRNLYLKVLGSCRSTVPELVPQILSTTNPDGKGSTWVRDRFVYCYAGGKMVPWGTVMVHPITKLTRVFIPAKLEDNPFLDGDTTRDEKGEVRPGTYRATLMQQDTATKRAWLYGDWDAARGPYFPDFRPNGPKPGDAPPLDRARHVLPADSIQLKPWWTRWMSMDWGLAHNSAIYWYCLTDQKQVVVYREKVLTGMSSFDVGAEIGRASLTDLRDLPSHSMNMFLSPDVFRYTDETHTIGSQISNGIQSVLGPESTFLMQYTPAEKELQRNDPDAAWRSRQVRWDSMSRNTAITILPATNDRIAGWNYIRTLMRWWKVEQPSYSEVEAQTIYRKGGHVALEGYIAQQATKKKEQDEVLPKLMILDCCPKAIRALRDAIHDEEPRQEDIPKKHWEGADACFVAGTLIQTGRGPVPIENVRAGDLAWTRVGLREVVSAGMTNSAAPTICVEFSDGTQLRGTENHPVFANGKFLSMDSLRYGDKIESWSANTFSSGELSLPDTQTPNGNTSASIIGPAQAPESEGLSHCIARFGRRPMDLFQKVPTSTTGMRTRLTMILQTWSACLRESISGNILGAHRESGLTKSIFGVFVQWPQNGMVPALAASGTLNTGERFLGISHLLPTSASTAETNTRPGWLDRGVGSVQTIAGRHGEGRPAQTMKCVSVQSAQRVLSAISTKTTKHAPVSVVRKWLSRNAPVYNLTVAGQPEYYANGILVHNCDSIRYGLMAHSDLVAAQPKQYFIADKMAQAGKQGITDMTLLSQMAMMADQQYESEVGSADMRPFRLGRASVPSASESYGNRWPSVQ